MLDADRLAAIDRAIVGDVLTADHAWENLKVLCDRFGSRFGGTEGEKQARDYLAERMRAYGLDNVVLQEFEYTGWARGTASLEVLAPRPMTIPCIALPYCPTADVTAELASVGDGAPAEFALAAAAGRLRGSACMATTRPPRFLPRGMHRAEKFGRAVAAGAAAFIWMRHEGGLLPETGSLRWNRAAEVPGVGVSYEGGSTLLRLAEEGPVRLRVRTTNTIARMPSWNVVGEVRGRSRPEEVVLFGAHFDGHDIAVGARDDGSGACVILEAARALAAHGRDLDRTVRFVTFPLEEIGLIGAAAYVEGHRPDLGRHVFMMNMDAAGGTGETTCVLQGWPDLVPHLRGIFRGMREPVQVGDRIGLYSDMYPFSAAGVPSGMLGSHDARPGQLGRGWGHTAADTLDKVSPKGLRMDAALAARLAVRLSHLEPFPAAHKTPAEVRADLEAGGLVEILEYEKREVPGAV